MSGVPLSSRELRQAAGGLLTGALFSAGLVLAGMTRPGKVVAFLDFFGDWDPSLMFVMVGGIAVYAVAHRLVLTRSSPVWNEVFSMPTNRTIDWKLIVGAILFGVGWGLGGFCPGPAITSLGTGGLPVLVFVGAMVGGMLLHRQYAAWETRRQLDALD